MLRLFETRWEDSMRLYALLSDSVNDLSNAMGRVEERSKAQEKQLTKVAEKLEDVSKEVHSAKVGLRVVGIMLGLGLAFLAWITNNAVKANIVEFEARYADLEKPSPSPA